MQFHEQHTTHHVAPFDYKVESEVQLVLVLRLVSQHL